MLSFLVTSKARRRLLELLWLHGATGSASELARRARVTFSTVYRELKAMEAFGLVTVRGEGGRDVYAAAVDHPEAELLRRLVATKPSSAAPRNAEAEAVRRRARALGAPLPVATEPVPDAEREQVVVDAVRLARRDATFARVMPVLLWAQRDKLDRARLQAAARRAHEKHALGFLVALTAELAGDRELRAWSERLRDHRARGVRPFFALPSARAARDLADRRSPQVARDWGFTMDLDLDAFRGAFERHGRAAARASTLDPRGHAPQAGRMSTVAEPRKQVRSPSASAAASTTASTAGRTPLERIRDALELGRRGRNLQQLARHERSVRPRAR